MSTNAAETTAGSNAEISAQTAAENNPEIHPETQPETPPVVSGLALHKDRYLGFSLFYPSAWHQFQWLDGRRGVLYGPIYNDNSTIFAVAVQDLGIVVNKRDLKDLHVGFIAGIGRLAGSRIESQRQWQSGPQIGMEAHYTFSEGDDTRKRWVRVLYQDTRQFTVTAQGATVEEFDKWLSTFQAALSNFRIYAAPQYKQRRPTAAPAVAPETLSASSAESDSPTDSVESTDA